MTMGLRVTEDQAREGLDTASHGERATTAKHFLISEGCWGALQGAFFYWGHRAFPGEGGSARKPRAGRWACLTKEQRRIA